MKTVNDISNECRRMVNVFCDWHIDCEICQHVFICDMMHLALDMILRGEY